MRRRAWFFAVATGMTLLASSIGCGSLLATPKPLARSNNGPGTLVEIKSLPDIDPIIRATGAQALRVVYRSTSDADGSTTIVSGAVFIPGGRPPPGGWIVLAYAHGTSGINNECGPSLSPNLFGTAPMIAGYLKAGYAVAAPDYQGLGEPGIHVYLDAKAAGYNVIDAVRALHNARPGVISNRWVAVGGSQGGGASWAAAEQAPVYAPELHLIAAVNAVPAANIAGYAQKAADESMTPTQTAAYVWILMAQSRVHPELDMDLYRRGSVQKNWEALSMCFGSRAQERNDDVAKVKPDEVRPSTAAAMRKLADLLAAMALPQRKADAPMLVIYAGKDEYIEPAWTHAAIVQACRMGSRIEVDFQPDKGHGSFDASRILPWLGDRVAGKPFHDACSMQTSTDH